MTKAKPRVGSQVPTFQWCPPGNTAAGSEAVELYNGTGKTMDPWEANVLRHGLAERRDGTPAVFQGCVIVSRQNGKGEIIEGLELNWMFLPQRHPIRLITHSAHQFDTSREAFLRMIETIEGAPDLDREVARISRTHGEEGIQLRSGLRLQYRTRSGAGGGRGFTGDKIVLDEAMILGDESIAALLPTLSTKPAAQIWYFGSAGDKRFPTSSVQLGRIRRQGLAKEPRVGLWAWEAPKDVDPQDRDWWYRTNPGLGIRITEEYIQDELSALKAKFPRERLGVGDYPAEEGWELFNQTVWASLLDRDSTVPGKVAVAIDVDGDRSRVSIVVTGRRADGKLHTERIRGGNGLSWVPAFMADFVKTHRPLCVVVDPSSPARTLIRPLEDLKIRLYKPKAAEVVTWCSDWYDAVSDRGELIHLGQTTLTNAVAAVRQEFVNSVSYRWSRKDTTADITPLWGSTLSLGGFLVHEHRRMPLVASA